MTKSLCMAGAMWVVLMTAAPEVSAQVRGGAMPNRVPAPKPERMSRQEHVLDRWAAMPPKQREAALSRMAPQRAEKLRERLKSWEAMTPDQKERARHFAALPANQKQIVRDHADWMQTLAAERRQPIRKEINSLQTLSPEARQAETESPSFIRRFNEDEREHIRKLVSTMEE